MSLLTEIQYREIPGPINIYGSCVCIYRKRVKLFIAARNQVFCFQSSEESGNFHQKHVSNEAHKNAKESQEKESINASEPNKIQDLLNRFRDRSLSNSANISYSNLSSIIGGVSRSASRSSLSQIANTSPNTSSTNLSLNPSLQESKATKALKKPVILGNSTDSFLKSRHSTKKTYSTSDESGIKVSWNVNPLLLANIPPEGEIVAIDCISEETIINQSNKLKIPLFAAAVINPQSTDPSRKTFLNIYGLPSSIPSGSNRNTQQQQHSSDEESESPNDDISVIYSRVENQTIRLDFIPFQLRHVVANVPCFLLSGSDNKVHTYQLDPSSNRFVELNTVDIYPQLVKLPSSALSFEIKFIKSRRMVAVGCQDGYTQLSITDLINGVHSVVLDGPVSAIKIFEVHEEHSNTLGGTSTLSGTTPAQLMVNPVLSQLQNNITTFAPLPIFADEEEVYVAAADTVGMGFVFSNIHKNLLKDPILLPESDKYDSITCIAVADIDFDGENELLLGTYGQQLLVYKERTTDLLIVGPGAGGVGVETQHDKEFYLMFKMSFLAPVMALHWTPLIQDGVRELIVVTTGGVHVLQPNLEKSREKILTVLDAMTELKQLENQVQAEAKRFEHLKMLEQKVLAIANSTPPIANPQQE